MEPGRVKASMVMPVTPDVHGQQRARLPPASRLLQGLMVWGVCVLWMAASSGLILVNKHILVDCRFRFPITVAALGMISSSILCALCCNVLGFFACTNTVSFHFYTSHIMPVGFFMAVTFVTGNTGYLYLTVSFVQMLKAFCPVITMLLLFITRLEVPSQRLIASVCFIASGIAISSYGEVNMHWLGLTAMSVSVLSECIRLVMVQHVLVEQKFSPMEGVLYMAPACSLWLAFLVVVLEPAVLLDPVPWTIIKMHPVMFATSSVMGFVVNVSAFMVIKLASSLTLKVLGSIKDALLVMIGVVFLQEVVTGIQAIGYCISLIGFTWYNIVKLHATAQQANKPPAKRWKV